MMGGDGGLAGSSLSGGYGYAADDDDDDPTLLCNAPFSPSTMDLVSVAQLAVVHALQDAVLLVVQCVVLSELMGEASSSSSSSSSAARSAGLVGLGLSAIVLRLGT